MPKQITELPKLIPVSRAAFHLSCTQDHVRKLIREGKLQVVKIGETRMRVKWESLERFMEGKR